MEEQIFLDFQLRFNLRQTKKNKPTIIYAIVCWRNKQYKINTSVKVYPHHWNADKQVAMCSGGLTRLDMYNNSIVNNKLKEIHLCVEQIKQYLCHNADSISNIYLVLKEFINPKMRSKSMPRKTVHLLSALRSVVGEKNCKESSKNTDYGHINVLAEFLKKRKIPLELDYLNLDTIEEFQSYLIDEGKLLTTINQTTSKIISLAKLVSSHRSYRDVYDWHEKKLQKFRQLKSKLSKAQQRVKQVILTESELDQYYACNNLNHYCPLKSINNCHN